MNLTNAEFEPLVNWMKTTLGDKLVQGVKVTNRLTDSPAVLVQAEWGQSPTMQRYMRGVASSRGEDDNLSGLNMMNQATLEINAEHPVIKKLKEAYTADPESTASKDLAFFAYEIAALTGGYMIDDTA